MNYFQALILGIIQGLTEFLPVSSTAHLRVLPALAGWPDPGAAFTAVIQFGTLLAVMLYFWSDMVRLTRAFLLGVRRLDPWGTPDARLAWMILLGTIPVVVCGLAFKKAIEHDLRNLYVVSAAAIGLALLLAVAEALAARRARQPHDPHAQEIKERGYAFDGYRVVTQPPTRRGLKEMDDLTWADALVVGLAQAVALIPGASRSGVTLTGGLFAGMTRATAARFSFLLSLPAVFAAGVLELYKERQALLASADDVLNLLIASAVSFVVGYASIAFLLGYLKTHSTWVFILYRLALGGAILVLLRLGMLVP